MKGNFSSSSTGIDEKCRKISSVASTRLKIAVKINLNNFEGNWRWFLEVEWGMAETPEKT